MCSHRHVILHLPAKFCSNQAIADGVMMSYAFFSRWPPAAILDLIWVMLDHPRSAIAGLNLLLKFGLNPMYTFGDIAIFIFCCFGLKLPIYSHFWRVLGEYFPQIWSSIVPTSKRTILARKHVVWVIKRENQSSGSTWAWGSRKKVRTGQDRTVKKKSQGGNISPIWGEAPTVPIETKNCVAGKLVNVTCAKFQDDILRGYYGVEFPIFLFWFLFGPYNSEALLRCLWYWEMFCVNSMAGFKYAMRIFQLSKQSCYDN